ncbi:type II toxin-antitoxin system HicA family toxin [Geminocystis sp. GBBB08]|uniref:type II toxin-antitoxin system HicA family toxin n=1 Tax=Geminocystis sp. GBBB08 TaxID=2604140 RepID=UPI0027E2A245|nr:type II toxin-antitoxin system HicA family toxin [Geminocystis sp. GBBB08]
MPKNIPSLKPKELIKILEKAGCKYYREGKGDHRLYVREFQSQKRIVSSLCFKNFSTIWFYR